MAKLNLFTLARKQTSLKVFYHLFQISFLSSVVLSFLYIFVSSLNAATSSKVILLITSVISGCLFFVSNKKLEAFIIQNKMEVTDILNSYFDKALSISENFEIKNTSFYNNSLVFIDKKVNRIKILSVGKVGELSIVFSTFNETRKKWYSFRVKKETKTIGNSFILSNSIENKEGVNALILLNKRTNESYKALKSGNTWFNDNFIVYSNNYKEIKSHLTEEFIEKVSELQRMFPEIRICTFHGDILISFRHSNLNNESEVVLKQIIDDIVLISNSISTVN